MKTKIAAIITALLLIFVGAGGIYYISKNSPNVQGVLDDARQSQSEEIPENQSVRYVEEPKDTRIEDWLKFIGRRLELEMLNVNDEAFPWSYDGINERFSGQVLVLENLEDGTIDTVLDLFEEYNFEPNEANTVEENQIYGFEKDDIACLAMVINQETQDLEVTCGLINQTEMLIKKLYFDELDKDPSTIQVDVIQSTSDHVSGSIQLIEPDEEAAALNSVESFLAAKDENGAWVLVTTGNKVVSCEEIEPYDFPTEMVPECFDEETAEMIERTNTDQTTP